MRELEVRKGDLRVKVSRDAAPAPAAPTLAELSAAAPPPAPPASRDAGPAKAAAKTVNAPLTGIFYRSPSPQSPAFVQAGGVISAGDVVGLIEAMKLFNEVRATVAGRVRRIVAENGQLVRAHQPLIELE